MIELWLQRGVDPARYDCSYSESGRAKVEDILQVGKSVTSPR
jgi:hypothetical protein